MIEIRNIPNDEYHKQTDYKSASMIKGFLDSRRNYNNEYNLGNPRKSKAAFDLGNVAHAMILEPHKIDEIAIVIPEEVLSVSGSKAGANWKQFKAENDDVILLKSSEMEAAQGMFESVYQNENAKKLLTAKGETEESFFQSDDWGKFRCRVDRRVPGQFIVDLKTTRDTAPDKFERQARELNYHIQAELYRRICDEHFKCSHTFMFIAVRSTPPYNVGVYSLSEQHLFYAGAILDRATEAIKECEESGDWREIYEKSVIELQPPTWWKPNEEGDDE